MHNYALVPKLHSAGSIHDAPIIISSSWYRAEEDYIQLPRIL